MLRNSKTLRNINTTQSTLFSTTSKLWGPISMERTWKALISKRLAGRRLNAWFLLKAHLTAGISSSKFYRWLSAKTAMSLTISLLISWRSKMLVRSPASTGRNGPAKNSRNNRPETDWWYWRSSSKGAPPRNFPPLFKASGRRSTRKEPRWSRHDLFKPFIISHAYECQLIIN